MRIGRIGLFLVFTTLSCKSTDSSSVKDVLHFGKTGAMMFYREGSDIKIKACKTPVPNTEPKQSGDDCELKEGTEIQTVAVEDFRKDLIQGLKLQVIDPNIWAAVEKMGQEEQAKAKELAELQEVADREQLRKDITAIRQMANAVNTANDSETVAVFNRVLAVYEAKLAQDVLISPQDIDPINAVVMRLIDDMISTPGVIILNADSGADLFFALLEGYITNPVRIEFVLIPPDRVVSSENPIKFMMGSPKGESERDDEPLHEVTLTRGFEMSKYEITQGEWRAVMATEPSRFKGSDDLPVESVSWLDAQGFIRRLNGGTKNCGDTTTVDGFKKARSTSGCYRLPTEAEWEYAARAGTTTPYYTGKNITSDHANYNASWPEKVQGKGVHRKKTVSVKYLYSANPWGLKHMSGNVMEWVQDAYGAYDLEKTTDPVRMRLRSYEPVIRGGGLNCKTTELRSAARVAVRDYRSVSSAYADVGFRLVRTL